MAFAKNANAIPLILTDIHYAARQYPIVFTQGEVVFPVALVGLGQNYFIDATGKWMDGYYVPAYVRKYPFTLMETSESDTPALCVDGAALKCDPRAEGAKLYENGCLSAFAENAMEFCVAYQEQERFTREFCTLLKQKEMLTPKRITIPLSNGKVAEMKGIQMLDGENLTKLSEVEILAWVRCGFMATVYYIIQSSLSLPLLIALARKHDVLNR
jgi:hypothetical protein